MLNVPNILHNFNVNKPGSRAYLMDMSMADRDRVNGVAKKRNQIWGISKVTQADSARKVAPMKAATNAVKKSVYDIKNRITVKGSTMQKWFRNPVAMRETGQKMSAFAKKNKGGIIKTLAVLGVSMAASKLSSVNQSRRSITQPESKMMFGNRSAYLPTSYKRGFNDIKELTTDFGSRVHLDKTITRVMRSARNSTRHGYKTNTASVINGNLALQAHKNAINHTRY